MNTDSYRYRTVSIDQQAGRAPDRERFNTAESPRSARIKDSLLAFGETGITTLSYRCSYHDNDRPGTAPEAQPIRRRQNIYRPY